MHDFQRFSYHSHTNFSDGKNTPEEMIAQAKAIGFTELGITDHLIVHKNITASPSWQSMTKYNEVHIYQKDFRACLPAFQQHCENLRKIALREKFKVSIGFEVDFFTYDGWLEELKDFLSNLDYDYVISGNHFLFDENCQTIYNINKDLVNFCDDEYIRKLIKQHFINIRKSVESRLFKFVAHLDYVRKMGGVYCQPGDYWAEKIAVLESLEKFGVGMEVSTKGLRKIGDYYPCAQLLQEASKRDISVVISDDAHRTSELGDGFVQAEAKLLENNLLKRLKF